jgi:UDP-N-acetylglucosamine acyltransferase
MDGTHTLRTINRVGLRRAGFSRETIARIAAFYRDYLLTGTLDRARLSKADRDPSEIGEIIDFVLGSRRGICFPGRLPDRRLQDLEDDEE